MKNFEDIHYYYVVHKQLQQSFDCEETTGEKKVSLYRIETGGLLRLVTVLELSNCDNSLNAINDFLNVNGLLSLYKMQGKQVIFEEL